MTQAAELKITVSLDGPYLVTGGVPLSRQVHHRYTPRTPDA